MRAISPRAKAWLEIVRLPNIFTAVADPIAGALVVGAAWTDGLLIALVALASACLYAFGMILNDWNDYRKDLRERPQRPLPSGRIRRWEALLIALVLMFCGAGLGWLAGSSASSVSVLLIAAIVLYDVLLKHVPIAPGIMGLCRALNLLLGMSAVPAAHVSAPGHLRLWILLAMALYVCGVTMFARREAEARQSLWLAVGAGVCLLGLSALAGLPLMFSEREADVLGYVWLAVLAGGLIHLMGRAILRPAPDRIQPAVKFAVLGIILFDAALVTFALGLPASLPIVALMAPALLLGRWLYST